MPPQNPVTRIEQVARDLGVLAREIEDFAGPAARRTLLYWQAELRAAVHELTAAAPHSTTTRPMDPRAPAPSRTRAAAPRSSQ